MAMAVTQIATAAAALCLDVHGMDVKGKPSVLGIASGAVAGWWPSRLLRLRDATPAVNHRRSRRGHLLPARFAEEGALVTMIRSTRSACTA